MASQPEFPFADRPLPDRVLLAGEGVRLREWTAADAPAMAELFDDREIAHWTPLRSPFDLAAAREYLAKAQDSRAEGSRLQLAITLDGEEPCGEILLFASETDPRDAEIGYSVGRRFRRRGLAAAAVRLMTSFALEQLRVPRAVLRIEPENAASNAVARAAGYRLTAEEPLLRELKGREVVLRTWARSAGLAPTDRRNGR